MAGYVTRTRQKKVMFSPHSKALAEIYTVYLQ